MYLTLCSTCHHQAFSLYCPAGLSSLPQHICLYASCRAKYCHFIIFSFQRMKRPWWVSGLEHPEVVGCKDHLSWRVFFLTQTGTKNSTTRSTAGTEGRSESLFYMTTCTIHGDGKNTVNCFLFFTIWKRLHLSEHVLSILNHVQFLQSSHALLGHMT